MAGRGSIPAFLTPEYDQMQEDFQNPELNSYDTGPGSYMSKEGANTKLYVTNIPSRLTEDGLMHIFSCEGEAPENVYIHRKQNQHSNSNTYWGFVTFKSIAAASNAMVAIHKRPPYNLYVHFARTNDDNKSVVSNDRHSNEEKPPSNDVSPRGNNIPSSRGRGKLPPMKGLPPSTFKAEPTNNEPYIYDLGEDYSPGRFSHCGISYEQNVSNSVFSRFAEGEYDDGKRKMTMGRGSYIASKRKDSVSTTSTEEIDEDMEQRVAAYLSNKIKGFLFDKDAFVSSETKLTLPLKPGSCSYCSRPAIYVCSKCKYWYCTNYCRKMDWNVHKNICTPRVLKFQDGLPTYEPLSGTPCSRDVNKGNSDGKQSAEHYNNSKVHTSKGEGSIIHDQSGHELDQASISGDRFNSDNRQRTNSNRIGGNRSEQGRHKGKNKKFPHRSYKNVETDVCVKGPPPILNGTIASKSPQGKKQPKQSEQPPISVNIFTKVMIGALGKNGEFCAYKLDDQIKQATMMSKLSDYCSRENIPGAEIKLGAKCIAPFEDDWFRAEIIDILNDFIKVLFFDYGNESLVRKMELKKLPEDLIKEPPLAHKFVLADCSNNPTLEMEMTLAIKPISQDECGRWIAQVEGVKYSENFEKMKDDSILCSVVGNNSLSDTKVKHFLSLLQNNDSAKLLIEKIMNDEFLSGTIIVNSQNPIYQEISRTIEEEIDTNDIIKLTPGKMIAAKWDNKWYRGYLMVVRDKKPVVALIDKGLVVIADEVAGLPRKVTNIPESSVSVIFEKPILNKNMAGETVIVKNISHDHENSNVHGEIEDFGKVIISVWVPALEEAGLDCIQISSGSKVQISAYHSPSAIYLQSCDSVQKTIRSELLQDVASCKKGQPLKRKPLIGEFLACRYIEDGYYYRAQVYQKEGGKYKVNFVDYGNTELVTQAEMKHLPDHLKKVPCCAVKVGLKNVPNVPFNTQCMKFLNELSANSIEMFVTYEKDLQEVTLELREGDIVNKVLFSLLEPSWNKPDFNPLRTHIFMRSEIKYEAWNKGEKFEMVVASVIRHDTVLALRPASGLLNHVQRTLTPMITEYCESKPNEPYNPRRLELCLAKFHEDEKWYRALCLKSYQHNAAEVFYFDYGNSGEVLHRCIRKMVPEFMEAPAVLKCCQISGLPEKVPELQSSKLEEYLSTLRTEVEVLKDAADGDCILRVPAVESYASQLGISIKHAKPV